MTARAVVAAPNERLSGPGRWRWVLCLLFVGGVHGAAMLAFREMRPEPVATISAPPAVLLDLEPPAAPAPPAAGPVPAPAPPLPSEPPPTVEPTQSLPQVPPAPHIPASKPLPKVADPVSSPRPVPRKPSMHVARHRAAEAPQPTAMAPSPAPSSQPSTAPPVARAPAAQASWESAVTARLARFKRYPATAQRRGEEGATLVRFVVDRLGMVHAIALARSSGHQDLDQEALSLVERAQPLPQPPSDRAERAIDLEVPIRFSLH
jgi:protein TonB